jgi:hypothetical protein
MKRMAFKVVDRVLVLAHGFDDPSDDEWFAYVSEIKRQGNELLPQVVLTDGGRPNSVQRKMLTDVLAGRGMKVAVLSKSTLVRGVVTAISWFNRDIRPFEVHELHEALGYLGVSSSQRALVESVLTTLRGHTAKAA